MEQKILLFSLSLSLFVFLGAGCQTNLLDNEGGDETMMEDDKIMTDEHMEEDDKMMEDKDEPAITQKITEKEAEPVLDMELVMEEDILVDNAKEVEENLIFQGQVLAGSSAPLLDFVQADYEKALQSGKLVVLYFYANWCPICKAETKNGLYPAFDELDNDNIIGFRVNYRDNQTDSNEENLAREFGVAYQHTKVFVKNGKRVLKAPNSWSKSDYIKQINSNL